MPSFPDAERKVIACDRIIVGSGDVLEGALELVIEGQRIAEIRQSVADAASPDDGERIDLKGATVMPGIVDAHMHFFGVPSTDMHLLRTELESYRSLRAAGEARKMLEAGITSARCLGSSISPGLRRAINEGHIPGPRLVTSGEFICSSAGPWADQALGIPLGTALGTEMIADGVDAVREMVRKRIRQGANVIKAGVSKGCVDDHTAAWGDDAECQVVTYSPSELSAIADEAHRHGLRLSAHCIGDKAVRQAIECGVDTIEHGFGISDDTRRMLAESDAIVVTTFSLGARFLETTEEYGHSEAEVQIWRRHLARLEADFARGLEMGVRYSLGSDLIGNPAYPQHMASKELELAVQFGMQPHDALQAATMGGAATLGFEAHLGTVEEGKLADLLAVDGDPRIDITLLRSPRFVMQDGKVIVREELNQLASTASSFRPQS